MNKWFRREYFVKKSSDAIVNKRGWTTIKRKYLFKVLKFTLTLTSHELTVAFLPLCFRNQPQKDSLKTLTALSL